MNQRRIFGAAIGGLVIISLIAAVAISQSQSPETIDPATPEGAVQSYVRSVIDEDWVLAESHFTTALAERCSYSDAVGRRTEDIARVSIDNVSISDDSAVVSVVMTHSDDDPLSTSTWEEDVVFALVPEDGSWRLDEVVWPYFGCEEPGS